jgi:hypothetical protein
MRVMSDAEAAEQSSATELDVWPNLYEPTPVELALRQEAPHSVFRPSEVHDTLPTRLLAPFRRSSRQRTILMAVLSCVVMLTLVLGGFLFLIGTHGQVSTKGDRSRNTAGLATTSVPTATTPPTATPRPTATHVPAPPATHTPQLVTIFSDPLTSNTNGWPAQGGCSFVSSGYQVTAGARCIAPVTAGTNVNISVQMHFGVSSSSGAGIGFRIPSGSLSQQYIFYVYSNGVCIARDVSTHVTFFTTVSAAVQKGNNATNTLTINQSGAQMTFYVNSTAVGGATDATLGGGEVALEANLDTKAVVFTNFTLTALK